MSVHPVDGVWVVIPVWESRLAVCWEHGVIPFGVREGERFHASVVLAAEHFSQLDPTDFEH